MNRYPEGYLCVEGRFRIGQRVLGPLYRGVRLSDGLDVIVAHGQDIADPDGARRLVERNRTSTPQYLGFGTIDIRSWTPGAGETQEDADYWDDDDQGPPGEYVCVEAAPGGVPLAVIKSAMHVDDVIQMGLGLCRVAADAQAANLILGSLRPESVWLAGGDHQRWRYTGTTPRCYELVMCGRTPPSGFDFWDSWMPPDADDPRYGGRVPPDTDVFAVAAVLWFAATREYPFAGPTPVGAAHDLKARRAFNGSPELAAVLAPVLSFDGVERASLSVLRDGLDRLATVRGLPLTTGSEP